MRFAIMFAVLGSVAASATTLQLLTTDQMIQQSTAIVRVNVTGSAPVARGRSIYTVYQLNVVQTLKGSPIASAAVPGGVMNGLRQMVAGAPTLITGQQYVLFLWTSPSGLTQIIGLSQGLFNVGQDASGNAVLVRPAALAQMVTASGAPVPASAVSMTLSSLVAQIQQVLNP